MNEIVKTNKKIEKYNTIINDIFIKDIEKNYSLEKLRTLYIFIKRIIPNLYINNKMIDSYSLIKKNIIYTESLFKETYIINSIPISIKKLNDYNDLDLIINEVREYLSKKVIESPLNNSDNNYKNTEDVLKNFDFANYCKISALKIKEICDNKGLKNNIIVIHPGYDKKSKLYNGYGFHYFNVVRYNNENYIVDATYRQFFNNRDNIFERVDVIGLSGVNVGFFMLQDKKRKELAKEILTKGYIKLTKENLKAYLDGFTMSFRNGLYYDEVGDYTFQNGYDIKTYEMFLFGEDSQVNHEGKRVLGLQKKPSKLQKK